MSSRRLGKRRQREAHHVQPVVQVLAEAALLRSAAFRSRLRGGDDAHVDLPDCVAPTGRTSRSCRTRSSFTCSGSGISPISSRKSVPPLAEAEEAPRGRAPRP